MKAFEYKHFHEPQRAMRLIYPVLCLLAALALTHLVPSSAEAAGAAVFFLVRHAEKSTEGVDPGLSAAGRQRADQLTGLLADAGIDRIYSTDFRRTRETVEPLARRLGLEVTVYDAARLDHFARTLKREGGRVLVVGHSNTTPELVERLGGKAGSEIDEPGEYDRLYILSMGKEAPTTTVLLRYGERYEPATNAGTDP